MIQRVDLNPAQIGIPKNSKSGGAQSVLRAAMWVRSRKASVSGNA
jgi:hypothetical protein